MSEAEQQQVRDELAWVHGEPAEGQWRDGQWCVTLKTRTLTIGFLVQPAPGPMRVALEVR
jgi:hypothetical protein